MAAYRRASCVTAPPPTGARRDAFEESDQFYHQGVLSRDGEGGMETVATIVEVIAFLFVLACGGTYIALKIKDDMAGWRKHWEAYRFWPSVRNGRSGL